MKFSQITITLFSLVSTLSTMVVHQVGAQQEDCDAACSRVYTDDILKGLCTNACSTNPAMFSAEFPYLLGPLSMQAYPELTNTDPEEMKDLTGTLYARVNADRTKMQFYLDMDTNPTPFFPYFAMHMHSGNLVAGEIGGSILVSIAGKGPIVGCVVPDFATGEPSVCSELCTPGSEAKGNCKTPSSLGLPACPLCDITVAGAYFCKGGCQGDNRILGNTILGPTGPQPQIVVPSRACDMNNDNPSSAKQQAWIPGVHSVEYSGNPEDGKKYSPYSIGIEENFDLWCGEELPFLHDLVFKPGQAAYVALHADFNATGVASLAYGDSFAEVSTSDGGVQNCTIFGSTEYDCSAGIEGVLPAISADPSPNTTAPPTPTPNQSDGSGAGVAGLLFASVCILLAPTMALL